MRSKLSLALVPMLILAACDSSQPDQSQAKPAIAVRSAEQDQLHKLSSPNLAIGLKRAIHAAGYTCKRVERAGFVGAYKNLDMWTATCSGERANDWAIFAGPDGSAQVRDCDDVARFGLPECKITKEPAPAPAA